MGVDFQTNVVIGKRSQIDDANEEGYDAVLVATERAFLSSWGIPGEH
jgi:NADPH-dependent glutamate synthase beta subunit-like oxidoreductase